MPIRRFLRATLWTLAAFLAVPSGLRAQAAGIRGTVSDDTGAALPGVLVELRAAAAFLETTTDERGGYGFDGVPAGQASLTFTLINFAGARREIVVPSSGMQRADVVLRLSLSADVAVTGKRTFTNLADAPDPARDLVGIAQSASQGAITARQLDARPVMRAGDVLETVPGVIISQHSGEGKANQYYLRGFNLDHGTDFATTVAGMPVNMPTHGHGHGYSDLSFLIPDLVSAVQFSKGPYFAEQGDFATAGSASINYTNVLDERMIARVGGGEDGYGRVLAATSPSLGRGRLLAAFELERNDGPWLRPDDYRKINALARYSRGDALNGLSLTAMGYHGRWNATDQVPRRAVADGRLPRFGTIDETDGGESHRYSGSLEWQRTRGNAVTNVTAYGIAYSLDLFSNFTFFLDDPERGDQFHQADRRLVSGGRVAHRRLTRWGGRAVQNTFGAQLRNDDIGTVGLYRTAARARQGTVREDAVLQSSGAVYAQNEVEWGSRFRTLAGIRADGYRFRVNAGDPDNGGTERAGLVSPRGGAVLGPWRATEFYLNAGLGFHSNDARGSTITRDPATGERADRVTPLVRARAAEVGVRSVAVPRLQTSLALWTLNLESELVFVGDAGTTDATRPSHRYGVEWASYYSPRPWLTFDGDVSISRARFTDDDPAGDRVPGAVETVVSAGATVQDLRNVFGGIRLRYFGSRPLVEDDSVRSEPTGLVNAEVGYSLTPTVRIALDLFNLFDAKDSDIDYFYTSRLPGEPDEGVDDVHFHPTPPRTARVSLIVSF